MFTYLRVHYHASFKNQIYFDHLLCVHLLVLLDFSLTVKAAPNEYVIRTSQL